MGRSSGALAEVSAVAFALVGVRRHKRNPVDNMTVPSRSERLWKRERYANFHAVTERLYSWMTLPFGFSHGVEVQTQALPMDGVDGRDNTDKPNASLD